MSHHEWQSTSLGAYLRFQKGVSYKGEYLDKPGLRLLGLGTIVPGGGISLASARQYCGPVKPHQQIQPGEVYVALTDITQDGRVLGSPALLPSDARGGYAVTHHVAKAIIERPEGLDMTFLYYLLQSESASAYFQGVATGTTVRAVSAQDAELLEIQLPPLSEQREIARILGALDDKIELNRRMNATLEAMARALFQSWFVDFDPVRAKAEGRQPVGMDAETAALFPNSFEDSALGPIPKGWKLGNIDDLTNLHRQTVDPGSKPTQLFAHYSLPAFDDGLRAEKVLGEQIKSNKYIVSKRAILVSKLNPHIPRVWLVSVGDNVPAICSTEFIVCTPKESSTAAFLYMLFTSEAFTTRYCGLVSGTTGSHQRVRPEDFRSMKVAIPNQSLVAAFTVSGGVLLSQSATLAHTNEVLRAARDTLLPKLLSGELRVGDVAA